MTTGHARIGYSAFGEIAPAALSALLALGQAVDDAGLDKRLTELVKLRASQINGCTFCVQYHLNVARGLRVEPAKLDLVAAWRDAGVFSARERAALAWAECLTPAVGDVSDDACRLAASIFRARGGVPHRQDRHHQCLEPRGRGTAVRSAAARGRMTAGCRQPRSRATVAVVEWPGSNSASATLPPQLSTSLAPTTVSWV